MLKRAIKQIALLIVISVIIIIVSGIITSATTNNANTFAIIAFPSLLILFFYFISKEIKYNRSLHQPNLSIQSTKTKKSSKTTSTKPTPINKEIVIEYSDSTGDITTRRIRVKEIKCDKYKRKMVPYSLYSYCFVKKAPRTFVIHNIISAYDAETGEIISDIPKYLMQ